jgi:DNA-binding NtrC family response regulator
MRDFALILADDDAELRSSIRFFLEANSYTVVEVATAKACREAIERVQPDAILTDCYLPDSNGLQLLHEIRAQAPSTPVLVMTGYATIDMAVNAMKEGAEQFIAKPFELHELLKMLEKVREAGRSVRREQALKSRVVRFRRSPFLGSCESIKRLEAEANRVVNSDFPVLILGETGTGKGVLAEWLTRNGPRAKEAFVDLNCAGLNRELLESDLFGHEKGAFTGAYAEKTGLLQVASRGTLFLDEIGDMDLSIQPRLLKVLDENRYRKVGSVKDILVDVRLLAATHRDLEAAVAEGKFRGDLYFRISTIPLRIPPLRQRIADIPPLANWIVEQLRCDLSRGRLELGSGVIAALEAYHWPGNIRELRNVLERAALICRDGVITINDLHFQLPPHVGTAALKLNAITASAASDAELTLEQLERNHISYVLHQENGRVDRAAAKLGIARSSLYVKIKQYGISARTN